MNPKVGTLPSFVVLEKGRGCEGTPQRASSPTFEKQRQKALSLVPTQWQPPTHHHPRGRAVGSYSQECMETLPWESWGSPQPWNVRVCEEVGGRV